MRLGARLRCPFLPAGRGKGNHGTWHALAMAFSPCLSRKSPSWDLLCACDGLFSLLVEEKGCIVAKSICPGSLLPLPQGKKVISKPIICRNVLCADRDYVSKHVACLRKHMGRSKRNIQQTERERRERKREREREREERRKREIEKDERESERTQDGEG